jgi:AbrB family looped-hinge helix DNA binding protein
MTEITISSKGQVVLPKELRDKYGWGPGTRLKVSDAGGRVTLSEKSWVDEKFPPISTEEFLSRRVKVDRPFPSDAEIDDAMLTEAARRFDATRR